jgi:hypothetical protein
MFAVSSSAQSGILSALIAPALFIATMGLGRWLKRRQGVRLGVLYFLFCVTFSVYVPLAFFGASLDAQRSPPGSPTRVASSPSLPRSSGETSKGIAAVFSLPNLRAFRVHSRSNAESLRPRKTSQASAPILPPQAREKPAIGEAEV